jgi:hypothetical protein
MKKVILILTIGFISATTFAQAKKLDTPNETIVTNPKLPDGVENGLSITYTKQDKLLFVTEKSLTLVDIDNIKVYINWYYNNYNAWSPQVTRKGKKWILLFERK